MKPSKSPRHTLSLRSVRLRQLGTASALLALAACASTPMPPDREIEAASMAIANAEKARVAEFALPELSEARDKLTAARAAVAKEEMPAAQRLAEEARVQAELASAKSEVARANVINSDMQKSLDTLKSEMQRSTGVPQ